MRAFKIELQRLLSHVSLTIMVIGLMSLQACKPHNAKTSAGENTTVNQSVVEVLTQAMDFQMADTIPSGWNTWRYQNQSDQTHFILIEDYPDGITLDSLDLQAAPVWNDAVNLITAGKTDEGLAELAKLPNWFREVIYWGGTGLVSPGRTVETTLKLEPGYYVVECYVKMNTGMWHATLGMTKELVVSGEKSVLSEPVADLAIDLSNEAGIEFEPPAKAGTYNISVNFIDQALNDINLVWLDEGHDLSILETWIDWRNPAGLREPAPEGFTFLGGVNNMPAGGKGYFKAQLQAGQYALISEVPNPKDKKLLKTFVISD